MKKKMAKALQKQAEEEKEAQAQIAVLPDSKAKPSEGSLNDSKEVLLMRVVTWLRDSHALFDYESRQIQKKNMRADNSWKFIRQKDEVKTMPINFKPDEDQESISLFSLLKDNSGSYYIDTEKVNTTEKLWLVVRAMK